MKKALITGISGQDGSYLAKLLLSHGYMVFGISRKKYFNTFERLEFLNIRNKIQIFNLNMFDISEIIENFKENSYDEIYHLAGDGSVSESFKNPKNSILDSYNITFNILEAIRLTGVEAKFLFASSGECFGESETNLINENSKYDPRSPYAFGKAATNYLIRSYRKNFNLKTWIAYLYSHESPLRSEGFVLSKIIKFAVKIHFGETGQLKLGNTNIQRDWGWAEEYVDAMWRILQSNFPDDYIIATGQSASLDEVINHISDKLQINLNSYIEIDGDLKRKEEYLYSNIDPQKILNQIGWHSTKNWKDVLDELLKVEMKL
jgi:GDPmannose 4,6-dehydratase